MNFVLTFDAGSVPRTVSVAGELDVESTSEFSQVILALYDVVGSNVVYDFRDIDERDDAARSTLTMLAHKFREFGRAVQLPERAELEPALN